MLCILLMDGRITSVTICDLNILTLDDGGGGGGGEPFKKKNPLIFIFTKLSVYLSMYVCQ